MPARDPARARLSFESLEDRAVPAANFDPTGVLVTLTGTPSLQSQAILELQGSRYSTGVSSLGLGVYRVDLASGVPVSGASWVFGKVIGVASVTPDYRVDSNGVPNDPSFSNQWALNNTGQSSGRVDADIDAPEAWNVGRGTGRTTVAIIDSGVDYRHPDLAANIWRNPREIAGNGRDDDGNGFIDDVYGADFANNDGDPLDGYGHGTHIAGIIGAVGNNGIGVSGVAWTTSIMALKFLDDSGVGYTSGAIRAIDYAIANGAKIINASWGSGAVNSLLEAAIGRAQAAGVIVVASAGNSSANTDTTAFYPAGYLTRFDNVVSVAATDRSDALASFSNYGPSTVTLAAPGVSIYSTLPNGRYGEKTGTSMAAPQVAGALAVLWDANPTWSYKQVIARLKGTVDPLATLAGKTLTGGRLNLANLLGTPTVPPVSPPPPTSGTGGPSIVAGKFDGPSATVYDRIRVTFSESINPATFTASDIVVTGPAGSVSISAILPVAGTNTQFQLMFSKRQSTQGTYTLQLGPDVRNLAGAAMDQNGNRTPGEAGDAYTLVGVLGTATSPPTVPTPPSPPVPPPPAPPTSERVTYSAGATTIGDRKTTRVLIPVTGNFRIEDLNVQLDITHARTSDLSIRLIAPDGTMVTLFNRRGDGANLYRTVFDDQGGLSIGQASSPFSGSYRPEQSLATLQNHSAQGVWILDIFDVVSGVSGTLNGVTLSFGGSERADSTDFLEPVSTRAARSLGDQFSQAVIHGRRDRIL